MMLILLKVFQRLMKTEESIKESLEKESIESNGPATRMQNLHGNVGTPKNKVEQRKPENI